MTIGNIDTKNVTAIFDKSNQDKEKIKGKSSYSFSIEQAIRIYISDL